MNKAPYNPGNTPALTQETRRGDPVADCTKKSASLARTVSHQTNHKNNRYGMGRSRDPWRSTFGTFVARETGTKYQAATRDYEPRSRESVADIRKPIDDATIAQERANLRRDLASDNPERSSTLEGIYSWLKVYGSLTPEQRAERTEAADAESVQRLTVRVAGSKGGE